MSHQQKKNTRVAYFNGQFIPEGEVRIPLRDHGFILGDTGYDMARTFYGVPFKMKEHIDRLYQTLRYLQIDPGMTAEHMLQLSEEVLDRNKSLLTPETDYWIAQRVTRGIPDMYIEEGDHRGPSVIIECSPIPFQERAQHYVDGISVFISSIRRTPPECLSPRAKTQNYINLKLADLEAKAHDPNAWGVMLDVNGNLCEGVGNNIFLIMDGVIYTPREQFVLAGLSRATVIDLAQKMGLTVKEMDLDLYDAYNAEEIFLTSTSLCICPVSSVNGQSLGQKNILGPITQKLIDGFSSLVNCDYVKQYLSHLEGK